MRLACMIRKDVSLESVQNGVEVRSLLRRRDHQRSVQVSAWNRCNYRLFTDRREMVGYQVCNLMTEPLHSGAIEIERRSAHGCTGVQPDGFGDRWNDVVMHANLESVALLFHRKTNAEFST